MTAQPFVGEIRLFASNFAPAGWHLCDGSLLAIADAETLFNLIGTTYGGDGQSNFAVPDLRGRVVVHQGQGPGLSPRTIGEAAGNESVTLTAQQTPSHTHALNATNTTATTQAVAANVLPAKPTALNAKLYTTQTVSPVPTVEPLPTRAVVAAAGGSQPHENRMPVTAMSYIISLFGIFPSQT